jgi:hypothetical protein
VLLSRLVSVPLTPDSSSPTPHRDGTGASTPEWLQAAARLASNSPCEAEAEADADEGADADEADEADESAEAAEGDEAEADEADDALLAIDGGSDAISVPDTVTASEPAADPPAADPPEADPPAADPPEADPPEADPPEADPPEADLPTGHAAPSTDSTASPVTRILHNGNVALTLTGGLPPELMRHFATQSMTLLGASGERIAVYRAGRQTRVGAFAIDLDSYAAGAYVATAQSPASGLAPTRGIASRERQRAAERR